MAELVVTGLTRAYGAVRAVDDISFRVADGELVTLLGPSGCGKSTTLFSIAGLDRATTGQIRVDTNVFFDSAAGIHLAPERRNCGLVFQSYALWPHMSVRENVEFPLKLRKVAAESARDKAAWALSLVEMEKYAARYPHELSGGQQQRVALARTLVYEPQVLLLDEPLSNLDAKLRLRARGWLRELQTRLKITTLYVTHDQEEALALSDRIAVMNAGRIVQMGTPREIYREPSSPFIADFVGHSNILVGAPAHTDETFLVRFPDGQMLTLPSEPSGTPSACIRVAIRPEHVVLRAGGSVSGANTLRGRIVQRDFLGTRFEYVVAVGEATLRATSVEELELGDVVAELASRHCMPFWGEATAGPAPIQ
ncbi:MAG: ABC transporter ATP-binding protein [Candidatus Binatia bacterium]